jgi:protein-tyrosine phosphatase
MKTELHWIEGPWPGRLAIMPRPRGGDWLKDEVRSWRRAGVDAVLSLLTVDEVADLDLSHEEWFCELNSIQFSSFPIIDRSVPSSQGALADLTVKFTEQLGGGKNIAVHCRQGIGRAALVAISLIIRSGADLEVAIQQVSAARGCSVPETLEQRRWLADFHKTVITQLPS